MSDSSHTGTAAHGRSDAVIEVKGLRKVYFGRGADGRRSEVAAVDGVDLCVRPGELVVLLGPSGCGKTTLLRCIAGLEQALAGDIAINGRQVFSAGSGVFVPPEQRQIGMMFQSYALWPHMTVTQNVAYPLGGPSQRASQQEQVAAMLDRLGVAGLGHRYPGELSGGQQQRVALARALIASPSVILFDEPLSNVDAKVRRRLRAELRELKRGAGFAGVYVTHDQEEAMELADTLVVMDSGKIRQSDTPQAVYDHPVSSYVASFVGEINRWPARVQSAAAGRIVAACDLGRFSLCAGGMAEGAQGWLAIRPEHVDLTSPGPATAPAANGTACLPGLVREAIFLGARVECRITVGSLEITAWLTDRAAAGLALERGARVDVQMAAENLRWLPS